MINIDPNESLTNAEILKAQVLIQDPIFKRLIEVATYHAPKPSFDTKEPHQAIGSYSTAAGFLAGVEFIRTIPIKLRPLEEIIAERSGDKPKDPIFDTRD